jgi:predicted PurR-regulated permease PerM
MIDGHTGRVGTPAASGAGTGTGTGSAMERFGARWIGLFAATLIALYLCWLMAQPFVEVLLWATVLVIIFYPVHVRIRARVGRPSGAALLSCLFVGIVILGPLTLITIAIANEAVGAADALHSGVADFLAPGSRIRLFLDRWVDVSAFTGDQWKKALVDWVQERGGTIAGQTAQLAGRVLRTIVQVVLVVFTMYYLFRDGERVRGALHDVLPLEWEQSHAIFVRTHEVISASVHGVIVIAAIQGILGGLAFWALGLPSPLMWGAVMVLLSMIPVVGSSIIWVPTALYLLVTGHWIKATLLVAWGGGVIGMLDNILRPRLVGGRTRLHELIVFFSVLGGLQVFGILGLVVGPVVVAITLALLDVFRRAHRPAEITVTVTDVAAIPPPLILSRDEENGRGGERERDVQDDVEGPEHRRVERLDVEQVGDQRDERDGVHDQPRPLAEQRPGGHAGQDDA